MVAGVEAQFRVGALDIDFLTEAFGNRLADDPQLRIVEVGYLFVHGVQETGSQVAKECLRFKGRRTFGSGDYTVRPSRDEIRTGHGLVKQHH